MLPVIVYSFTYTKMYTVNENLVIHYGGIEPGVDNVIFTNGQLDSWYPLGIHSINDGTDSFVFDIPCKFICFTHTHSTHATQNYEHIFLLIIFINYSLCTISRFKFN